MNDMDKKTELPVHLIFGAKHYTKIKVQETPRVGKLEEPVAQLTCFGWLLMSPGIEAEINKLMCSKTSINDYENLCRLDVLSGRDIARNDIVGSKFLGSI